MLVFRHYSPGEEWEDDPMLVEFMKMDRDRQNPTADIHSMFSLVVGVSRWVVVVEGLSF